jgi:quercetin dioxygenase-like cupin family protein
LAIQPRLALRHEPSALVFPACFPAPAREARMKITDIPYCITDWQQVEPVVHPGEAGTATWRERHFGDVRVRVIDYSPGYRADHWCVKGHFIYCLEGELETELKNGRRAILRQGMSCQIADGEEAHRSCAPRGARLFVVD